MTNPLIGEEGTDPGPEFEVVAVDRMGWFSADVRLAARYAFTRRMTRADRGALDGFYALPDAEISLRQGETIPLLLPRRYAKVGQLVALADVAGNPALADRWRGVEGAA